ncbi:MAG: helix-turn-helix domain-containing protein [Anaerolineae bacterium]|nr:helix-turn-helix domain-containing protein [Anaerolineae bacterium]
MSEQWLTLTEAARFLGVHANTLRRWANNGRVPYHTTPGGHRRFMISELETLVKNSALTIHQENAGRIWADYALVETRERLQDTPARWQQVEGDREEKRELGRRLLGLIIQHISNGDEALLIEAASIGVRYAQSCIRSGLSVTEGLEATMFFRDAMTEVALQMPEVAHIGPEDQVSLLRKLNQVFNTVQKSVVDYYDKHNGAKSDEK